MNAARIYRNSSKLIAIPATGPGDRTADHLGLTDTVFHGRPAPLVLVQAMLTQFGGKLLSEDGRVLRVFERDARLPMAV